MIAPIAPARRIFEHAELRATVPARRRRGPHRRRALGWLVGICCLACCPIHATGDALRYELSPEPRTGRLAVELVWETGQRRASSLVVASRWGTVARVASLLRNVQITGGRSVQFEDGRWRIEHHPDATLTCRYIVDAGRRTHDWDHAQHPITTRELFLGLGNTFLLTPLASELPLEVDVVIRWKLPPAWTGVCSLGRGPVVGGRVKLEALRRSVFFAGRIEITTTRTRTLDELTVALGPSVGWDSDEFARLAARIIDGQVGFMGEADFPPFLITVLAVGDTPGFGATQLAGMGLHQSLALYISPGAELGDGVQHLLAHEFFHFWNGGVLKPRAPEELVAWFVEGLTDYYALRLLGEEVWTPATLAKWLNRHIREYHDNPAIRATNEEIRDGFKSQRATVGEVAYQRGLLLGLRWHALAIRHGVPEGLDRLFRALVERGRSGGFELTNKAIRQIGSELLGSWFAEEFDRFIERAEVVEVPADALLPLLRGQHETVYTYDIGFERAPSLGEKRIQGLRPGSAAARAGLREGDALTGWHIPGEPDGRVSLQVRREANVQTISYLPRGPGRKLLQFRPVHEEHSGSANR